MQKIYKPILGKVRSPVMENYKILKSNKMIEKNKNR